LKRRAIQTSLNTRPTKFEKIYLKKEDIALKIRKNHRKSRKNQKNLRKLEKKSSLSKSRIIKHVFKLIIIKLKYKKKKKSKVQLFKKF